MECLYGERRLISVDHLGRLQCHRCGRYYVSLSAHIRFAHTMTAVEYRREFWLDKHLGLISAVYHRNRQQIAHRNLEPASKLTALYSGEVVATPCVVCGCEFHQRRTEGFAARLLCQRPECHRGDARPWMTAEINAKAARARTATAQRRLEAFQASPDAVRHCCTCGEAFRLARPGGWESKRVTCGRQACVYATRRGRPRKAHVESAPGAHLPDAP